MLAVIRYFGGIKLGTGGLARAYGNTARLAIESNHLIPFIENCRIRVTMEYNQLQQLEYWLKKGMQKTNHAPIRKGSNSSSTCRKTMPMN